MKKRNSAYFLFALLLLIFFFGRYWYLRPRLSPGEIAPDFIARDYKGDTISLGSFRGSYLLLDFWGSWCGPCRKDNPGIVSIYEQFKDQKFRDGEGFKVLSVAAETNTTSWEKAISKDQLNWEHHILSLDKFKHPVFQLYKVREIPTKYLINPRGIIIGVNPGHDEMRKILTNRQ